MRDGRQMTEKKQRRLSALAAIQPPVTFWSGHGTPRDWSWSSLCHPSGGHSIYLCNSAASSFSSAFIRQEILFLIEMTLQEKRNYKLHELKCHCDIAIWMKSIFPQLFLTLNKCRGTFRNASLTIDKCFSCISTFYNVTEIKFTQLKDDYWHLLYSFSSSKLSSVLSGAVLTLCTLHNDCWIDRLLMW